VVRCDPPVHTVGEIRLFARVAMLGVNSRAHNEEITGPKVAAKEGKPYGMRNRQKNHGALATIWTSAQACR
jgi:hypothetical protein